MIENRSFLLTKASFSGTGPVAYWMSRDQRVQDNWALLTAQQKAKEKGVGLLVFFCIFDQFPGANARHFHFMIGGLEKVETDLQTLHIPFVLLQGNPVEEIASFVKTHEISMLVTDFDPLRIKRKWKNDLTQLLTIPFLEVDAHNIVPCFKVSTKLEYGAYTIRPKLQRLLNDYLVPFPLLEPEEKSGIKHEKYNWENLYSNLQIDRSVKPISWLKPGEDEALRMLQVFVTNKLHDYNEKRNDQPAGASEHRGTSCIREEKKF